MITVVTASNSSMKILLRRLVPIAFLSCGFGFFLTSCTLTSSQVPPVQNNESGVRIMPLGDSITQADRNHNSYRRSLWLKLRQAGYSVNFVGSTRSHFLGNAPQSDFDQDHEGHWGWQVDQVLAQIDGWTRSAKPDVVLLHLGTNDLLRGERSDAIVSELRQLIEALRRQNNRSIILLAQLIPSSGAENQTQQFNQRIAELARSMNSSTSPVILVDQYTGFNATQDTYDGLHPNSSGEEKMAVRWFSALQKVLPKQP